MTKTGKVLTGIVGVIVLLLVAAIVFIKTFDWNRLKPTINEKVSTELQRPFAIRGNLGVDWSRKGDEPGWRGWVPWPHIYAEDLVLGNPPDLVGDNAAGKANTRDGKTESTAFPTGEMVTLKRVDASIAPLALLAKEVWIPRIWLTQPDANLLRLADGKNNWTFNLSNSPAGDKSSASDWSVNIDDIVFDRGQINLKDAVLKADLQAVIDPLGKPLPFSEVTGTRSDKTDKQPAEKTQNNAPDFIFGWKVDGKYQGQPLTGSGKIGGMLSMSDASMPFPLQADVRSGSTRIAVAGTLTDPANLAGLDLQLKFSGASLDNLYPLIGVLLPATPPFNTDGRLIASLKQADGAVYRYENFNGKIGDSDIHGNLTYTNSQPRPKLTGNLSSDKLRFADLAPLIGADSNQEKANRGERDRQPSNKVLPTEKFDTQSWGVMDADVTYAAKRIDRDKSLPLTDLSTHVVLNNGELLLDPLRFGMARGELNATLRLNGNKNPMQGKVDLHARRLQLKELLPQVQSMRNSLGQLNGDASFTATGNSVAALLATSNGHLRLLLNQGLISRSLMELLGLNVGNYLVTKLFGDDEVKINCAIADVQLRNGLATPRLFIIDTENAIINITGNINFATERLDLSIDPESKGLRILTLRSPLYVKGTFKKPDAGVKTAPLLARGAVAAVLGVALTPAAALLALISPSEAEENQCTPLLQKMKQKK